MKKSEIKTGVVYAYQRSAHYSPVPVVFLSTDLHRGRSRMDRSGPWATKAYADAKPGKDYLGTLTGYPAVFRSYEAGGTEEQVVRAMLGATLDQALDGTLHAGLDAEIVTILGRVKGFYSDVKAEYERAQEARRQQTRDADARRQGRYDRSAAVIAAFKAHGVFASWRGNIELTLENAEKLVALLLDDEG